jgi:MSHA biogenesis protein MshP
MFHRRQHEQGFLLMAAVFLVVVVGAFIGYIATQANVQEITSADDVQSVRALQAARAGVELGAYQVIQNGTCPASSLTFPASTTLAPFTVAITCTTSASLTEGATTEVVYNITANACNVPQAGTPCPNSTTTSAVYVDREVSITIAKCTAGC